ncbi:MAG: sugar isomerase [Spirochaetes bacterium]|nr:sugar isomerase [Spirochaetota bacterium]
MDIKQEKNSKYHLIREMAETASVVKRIAVEKIRDITIPYNRVLLSGEGSSRIFPAKNTIYQAWKHHYKEVIYTEGGMQASEYDLTDTTVFVASNSGKTAEGVLLIRRLKAKGKSGTIGVVANSDTPIMQEAGQAYILQCGKELAVAATKSVMEQALFYDILFRIRNEKRLPDLLKLGSLIGETFAASCPEEIIRAVAGAHVVYFAGRNNGVAEELTLKTNEITRKKSDYLEGTYAVHGIEEVMNPDETVVLIEPFPEEEEKFMRVLVSGVGLKVVAVASRPTRFPTFVIPDYGDFSSYLQLAAGWNLLGEAGIRLGIDLDKPERARKVGNEFTG